MFSIEEVRYAIDHELEECREAYRFVIKERRQRGAVWSLTVDGRGDKSQVDESIESAVAWWPAPTKGAADVLAAIPEREEIHIRYATAPPPPVGESFFIYPPQYLQALRDLWAHDRFAEKCCQFLERLETANQFDESLVGSTDGFRWLRTRQRDAFKLTGWNAAFLWGPPGTGKTTTLGALLASYLSTFWSARVLLCSTTNSAVDQALIEVDKKLEELAAVRQGAGTVRRQIFRIGNHFEAHRYEGREHLIPVSSERLMRELMRVEAQRPAKTNIEQYAAWKAAEEAVREKIRKAAADVVRRSRLIALTTTGAAYRFDQLREFSPFHLVIFDEASQIATPYALAVAQLARKVLFAGDPKQLPPIVQSDHPTARKCLGSSIFDFMRQDAASTCQLVEQSRMAEEICNVVSNVFYGGTLRVAADARADHRWAAHRRAVNIPPVRGEHVFVRDVPAEGIWSARYHGPIRHESAEWVRKFVQRLIQRYSPNEVLVLTPFRAQRSLLKAMLQDVGHGQVAVSTVHRAQGSERHIVIFDPVQGSSPFLMTADARRLVNVGISRAKNLLVVLLSAGDRANPLLREIASAIDGQNFSGEYVPIDQRIASGAALVLGEHVSHQGCRGVLQSVNTANGEIVIGDATTGRNRKFRLERARLRVREAAQPDGFERLNAPLPDFEGRTARQRDRVHQPSRAQSLPAQDVREFVGSSAFPGNMLGHTVKIGESVGKVISVNRDLIVMKCSNGRSKKIPTREIRAVFGKG